MQINYRASRKNDLHLNEFKVTILTGGLKEVTIMMNIISIDGILK